MITNTDLGTIPNTVVTNMQSATRYPMGQLNYREELDADSTGNIDVH
jgi:hypothetical protein